MKAEIVPADESHIPHIAANVREADRQELWDYALLKPEEALHTSLKSSTLAWTGLVDGIPLCMFGVGPFSMLTDSGFPWMIGTKNLDQYAMTFLRRNKKMVHVMLKYYSRLGNWVSMENTVAIQWLKWLGFQFGQPEPKGLFHKPFIKFWMVA